jgi:hypothetical protein
LLPATTELMAELTRYRRHYGLAALPYGGETTPLLLPIGGTHRTMTRGAVSRSYRSALHSRPPYCNRTVVAPAGRMKKMGDTFCAARFQTSHVTSGHYLTLPAFHAERSWS